MMVWWSARIRAVIVDTVTLSWGNCNIPTKSYKKLLFTYVIRYQINDYNDPMKMLAIR